MRVAMVSGQASPLAAFGKVDAGGRNVHVAGLSAALSSLGHEVVVYTRRDAGGLPGEVAAPGGYRVVHVDAGPARAVGEDELPPYMGDFAVVLRRLWRDWRPDVVHAHHWMSGLVATSAAHHLSIPLVQTFHELATISKRHLKAADAGPDERIMLERVIGRRADRVVASCTDEAFELVQLGVPRQRISVVPSGVDVDLFTVDGPVCRRGRARRIVAVGKLAPRKGFDTIVAALPALPETELVIAGGPAANRLKLDPQARALLRLAEDLGVADRVRLRGSVSRADMPRLLRSADVVACMPWYEPFGIVPLEAMACGRPVVASAVGGQVDTVVDGVTGLHVPPRSPRALVDALRRLLDDVVTRTAYGMAGRDRAVARYSWDRVAQQIAGVHKRAVNGQHRPRLVRGGS
ncbi:glycosyltransferase [Actinocrispum sp. NPDC049592]|uniref:glycosyltransferase n=1 Tax=Actinocrispum sp. NPDC049592 TaxID=3154835 RepID=UPI00341FF53C